MKDERDAHRAKNKRHIRKKRDVVVKAQVQVVENLDQPILKGPRFVNKKTPYLKTPKSKIAKGKYDNVVIVNKDPFAPEVYSHEEDFFVESTVNEEKLTVERVDHFLIAEPPIQVDYVIGEDFMIPTPEIMIEDDEKRMVWEYEPPILSVVEHVDVIIELKTQIVEIAPVIDDIDVPFDKYSSDREVSDWVKSVKPPKPKFKIDFSQDAPKKNKLFSKIMSADVEDAEKIAADAASTKRGIARAKRAWQKNQDQIRNNASIRKQENIKVDRVKKTRIVQSWLNEFDESAQYAGDKVPKDKHQKKVRARKVSNLLTEKRPYTAEAVRAFREEKRSEKELKKASKNNVASSQGKNFITDALSTRFGNTTVSWIEWIINFLDVIRNVCRQKDFDVRRCLMSQWIQLQGFKLIESTVVSSLIATLIESAPHVEFKENYRRAKTQSGVEEKKKMSLSEQLDNVGDILEYTFESSFADAFKNLLISCASMGFFNTWVDKRIFRHLGPAFRMPTYDLVRIAIKSLAKVIKAMEEIADGAELSEALFMKDAWVFNKMKFSQLMFQQNHLYTGLPVEGKFPKPIWLKEADSVRNYFRDKLKKTSNLKPQYLEICGMVTNLDEAICNVQVTLSGGYRNAPFAVCLGKDPGVGKSNMIDFIVYEWCRVQGYNFTPDLIFHRDMTSEFWDGLSTQIAYHYSETGTASKKIAESRGDPVAMELTSIIDSVMKNVNMADVKDKGKVKALPQIVVSDTNNFDMNFSLMTCNKAAFLRRFLFIEMVCKPEYTMEGSCQIDWSKCNDDKHPLDRWYFTAWREICVSPSETKRVEKLVNGDIYALSALLRKEYTSHIASQTFVEDLRKNNDLFRLDEKEEPFPESVDSVSSVAPHGKTLVKEAFQSAEAYATFAKSKWDLLVTSLREKTKPMTPDDGLWDEFELRTEDSPIRADSFRQADAVFADLERQVYDFDAKSDEEFRPRTQSGKQLVVYQRPSGFTDDEITMILLDLRRAFYVRVAGRRYLYFNPNKSAHLQVGPLMRFLQGRTGLPVWYAYEFGVVVDQSNYEHRLLEDVEVIVNPKLMDVESYELNDDHDFAHGTLTAIAGTCHFWAATVWQMFLCLLCAPTLAFINFGPTGGMLQYFIGILLPYIIPGAGYVSAWMLCSYIWMVVFPYDPVELMRKKVNAVLVRCGFRFKMTSTQVKIVLGVVSTLGVILLYWRRVKNVDEKKPEEDDKFEEAFRRADTESGLKVRENVDSDLTSVQKNLNVGKSYRRVDTNKVKDTWIHVSNYADESKFHGKVDELGTLILKNTRCAKITLNHRVSYGQAIGIDRGCYVIPQHYFHDLQGEVLIELWCQSGGVRAGGIKSVKLHKEDFVIVGTDLLVFRMIDMPCHNVLTHISEGPGAGIGKGCFKSENVRCLYSKEPMKIDISDTKDSYILEESYIYDYPSVDGDCGFGLVFERDSGCAWVGIHVAGSVVNGKKYAHSAVLYRSRFQKAVDMLNLGISQCLNEPLIPTIVSNGLMPLSELVDPINKSSFMWNSFENLDLHGKMPGNVMINNKSRLKKSILAVPELLETWGEVFDRYPSVNFVPPLMQPKWVDGVYLNPYTLNLEKSNKRKKVLDTRVCRGVVQYLSDHLIKDLEDHKVPKLQPLDIESAINGVLEDEFLRRINASTASGFGLPGKKKKHLPKRNIDDIETEIRELTPELKETVLQVFEKFQKGEYVHFVYAASLKDEPRDAVKVAKGKTRVFFMSQLVSLVIARMLLSPFYTLMVQYSHIFGGAIGINMHRESGAMYRDLVEFSRLFMEGDYGSWDVSLPPGIGQMVHDIMIKILKEFGYNDYALQMVQAYLAEDLNVYVAMNGDIYSSFGPNSSGKFATAEDNTMKNLTALAYAFFMMCQQRGIVADFFTNVKPKLYGDDLLAAVKPEVSSWFNNVTYSKFVEEHFGMEFTTSAKGDVVDEFIEPESCSFLKRTFAVHPGMQVLVGRLDHNSIYKSLFWTEPSDNVSEAEQTLMTIDSALRESFFHLTKEKYNILREFLTARFLDHYELSAKLRKTHLHDYDFLCEFYSPDRKGPDVGGLPSFPAKTESSTSHRICEVCGIQVDYWIFPGCGCGRSSGEEKQKGPSKDLQDLIVELETELKELENETVVSPFPEMCVRDMRRLVEYGSSAAIRRSVDNYALRVARRHEIEHTLEFARSALSRHRSNVRFKTQSLVGAVNQEGSIEASVIEEHQNLVDVGGMENVDHDDFIEYNPPNKRISIDMNQFLSRPVEIGTYEIPLNANYGLIFDPWSLFLADPSVRAKLRNYAFLRGTLHVRIALTASPFHYGKFVVAYAPQAINNDIFNFYAGTAVAGYRFPFMQWMSQLSCFHIMDVGDNKPLDFTCPFVNFQNMIRLYNQATTAVAGAFTDAANLGRVMFYSLNNPTSVNSNAPTMLSATMYAWMEDVVEGGATGTQVVITTEGKNELTKGVVERTASALADVSGALTKVPIISVYARASQNVFSSLSYVASLFGWSAPMVSPAFAKPSHIKNDAFQNACETITYNMGKKMTFDPLQELSVDPRMCATDKDELSIAFLTQKESLLDTFTWNETGLALSTLLWSAYCHPQNCYVGPIAASRAFIQPTSLSFASRPFTFWHGKLTYRFVINRAPMHRGKLAVLFDPNVAQYVIITSTLHLNKQFSAVVDIEKTSEFSVCVEWNFPRQWAELPNEPYSNRSAGANFAAASAVNMVNSSNGFIVVTPFTALVSPDSFALVSVNVFISSEDMRFNYLDVNRMPQLSGSTQSKNSGTEYDETCFTLNEPNMSNDNMATLHFGEQPMSFRSYFKRFYTTTASTATTTASNLCFGATPQIFPDISPYFNGPQDNTPDVVSYVRYGFVGYKGSVRKRLRFSGARFDAQEHVKVTLLTMTTSPSVGAFATGNTQPVSDMTGTVTFVPFTNGGVEVEIPFYSNNLYNPSGKATMATQVGLADTNFDNLEMWVYYISGQTTSQSTILNFSEETAYGDDFTLLHFLAAPPIISVSY